MTKSWNAPTIWSHHPSGTTSGSALMRPQKPLAKWWFHSLSPSTISCSKDLPRRWTSRSSSKKQTTRSTSTCLVYASLKVLESFQCEKLSSSSWWGLSCHPRKHTQWRTWKRSRQRVAKTPISTPALPLMRNSQLKKNTASRWPAMCMTSCLKGSHSRWSELSRSPLEKSSLKSNLNEMNSSKKPKLYSGISNKKRPCKEENSARYSKSAKIRDRQRFSFSRRKGPKCLVLRNLLPV